MCQPNSVLELYTFSELLLSLYWPKLSSVSIPLYFYNLHVQVQNDMRNKKKINTFQEHDFVELGFAS